jgi:hypothetical protein
LTTTTLKYRWDERPASIPLTEEEGRLAMRLAEYDVADAAKLLKISINRLMPFILRHDDLYRQSTLRTLFPFISISNSEAGVIITIKPDECWDQAIANKTFDGVVTLTLNKGSKHASQLRRAQALLDSEEEERDK